MPAFGGNEIPLTDEEKAIMRSSLEKLRENLLDLSLKNSLLNFRDKGSKVVRIVDESLDKLFDGLVEKNLSIPLLPFVQEEPDLLRISQPINPKPNSSNQKREKSKSDVNESDEDLLAAAIRRIENYESDDKEDGRDEPDETEKDFVLDSKSIAKGPIENGLQTTLDQDALEARLSRIYSDYQNYVESTGSNLLFLAIGFLEWFDPEKDPEKPHLAPLILVPIDIKRELEEIEIASNLINPMNRRTNGVHQQKIRIYRYRIQYSNEDISDNLTLGLKLAKSFNFKLPELNQEGLEKPEDFLKEISASLDAWTHPLAKKWRVLKTLRIGFFTFSKDVMYRDLNSNLWKKTGLINRPQVKPILLGGEKQPTNPISFHEVEEVHFSGTIPTVMDADSSQMKAIFRANRGESVIIQGPPGTGKSQTITNIIASSIAAGKKVLFMAEKMAALEVVKSRLAKEDLGMYCLELHSKAATPQKIHEQIRHRLKHIPPKNSASDLSAALAKTNNFRQSLNTFCKKIGVVIPDLGCTFYEVIWSSEFKYQSLLILNSDIKLTNPKDLPGFCRLTVASKPEQEKPFGIDALESSRRILRALQAHHREAVPSIGKVWEGFNADNLRDEDLDSIEKCLYRCRDTLSELVTTQESFSGSPLHEISVKTIVAISSIPVFPLPTKASIQIVSDMLEQKVPRQAYKILQQNFFRISEMKGFKEESLANSEAVEDKVFLAASKSSESITSIFGAKDISLENVEKSLEACSKIINGICEIIGLVKKQTSMVGIDSLPLTFGALAQLEIFIESVLTTNLLGINSVEEVYFEEDVLDTLAVAEIENERIRNWQNKVSSIFEMDEIPNPADLRALRKDLKECGDSWIGWVPFGRYSKAKKLARHISRNKRKYTQDDFLEDLHSLIQLPQGESQFAEDINLKQKLGKAFSGAKTNWGELKSAISIALVIKKYFNLPSSYRSIVTNISVFSTEKDFLISSNKLAFEFQKMFSTEMSKLPFLNIDLETKPLPSILSDLEKVYDTCKNNLQTIFQAGVDKTEVISSIPSLVNKVHEYRKATREILSFKESYNSSFARSEAFSPEAWEAIDASVKAVDSLSNLNNLVPSLTEWLGSDPSVETRLTNLELYLKTVSPTVSSWIEKANELQKYAKIEPSSLFSPTPATCRPIDLFNHYGQAIQSMMILLRWGDFRRTQNELEKLDLGHIYTSAIAINIQYEHFELYAEAVFFVHWMRWLLSQSGVLSDFHRIDHEDRRKSFQNNDRRLPEFYKKTVNADAFASEDSVPRGISTGPVGQLTDMGLIRKEQSKIRRHFPVRELVRRSHSALSKLMPCWMMSPSSVSQFLPPDEIEFDILIMDEASQIRPEEAVGSIARAKQIIVVGDSKQMPPSSAFAATVPIMDDDLNQQADIKSILDLLEQYLPQEPLLWHYRSKHHSLILFSNEKYYERKLIIPPSPVISPEKLGIRWHYVKDGFYLTGKNPTEAKLLVDALITHILKMSKLPPDQQESIGVVVMNVQQNQLVRELYEQTVKRNSELESALEKFKPKDPIFIRNLENVQGDERDVIYIGFTYGPDPASKKVHQRFGPILNDGGWRRLNVLFTRAKLRMEIFSSMKSEDIAGAQDAGKRGVNDLKAFLLYAESGKLSDFGEVTGLPADSPFEEAVGQVIQSLGYNPHFQIGVEQFRIDIGVEHPNRVGEFIAGIECDGAPYHSHPIARDRDRLRQEILESRGWKIHRIWSLDWYRNRKTEIDRLSQYLKSVSPT